MPTSKLKSKLKSKPKSKYGLLGYGTVGQGVVRLLCRKEFGVWHDVKRDVKRDVKHDVDNVHDEMGSSIEPIKVYQLVEDVEFVFEATCGPHGLPWDACRLALALGKTYITANKAMVSEHYMDILSCIEDGSKGRVYIEACVCGGMPLVKVLQNHILRPQDDLLSFCGIVNGSTNWLLCEAQTRHTNSDQTNCDQTNSDQDLVTPIIQDMQDLGYLEADPSFDLEGVDAAYKLCIIKNLSQNLSPNVVCRAPCEASWGKCGLSSSLVDYTQRTVPLVRGVSEVCRTDFDYAKAQGYVTIKLLAICTTQVTCVLPAFVSNAAVSNALATTSGSENTVVLTTALLGTLTITAPGAGMYPTASAMMSDLAVADTNPQDRGSVQSRHSEFAHDRTSTTDATEWEPRFIIRYPDSMASDALKREGVWLQPWVYYLCSLSTLQNDISARCSATKNRPTENGSTKPTSGQSIDELMIFAVV
ncbi:homoserine dehydrogenase [Gregarina niphandrodes]|uniref:homoserine dehydrogenase n=1 Tax=Gregarina niphandrodes TaxID=110365 RepID=A0A023B261_GRENI|nr:homoserine dehydrogenase [Gregarina niphandrodes]EZG50646.1 homoserine dehydrogenase [Gregarina niphandrodes]|eukprot:XP_011131991.1 homoserine dehydrogenase [Gregarina niphandrodes]